MVHIEKKVIEGKTYLYLAIRAKVDGKSKRVWQKYLGPEASFQKKAEAMKLKLSENYSITTREFGLELALWQIAEELQLHQIIDDITSKRSQGLAVSQYLILSAINRIINPMSKQQIGSWLDRSYLKLYVPQIEDTYTNRLSMAYTNHFQYLTDDVLLQMQQKLTSQLLSQFDVKMDQLFYDPTNFYTFINPREKDELPRHGKSKEGRNILNLIGLSVVCTNDGGLPLFHHVYPGNVQDAELFKTQHQTILQHLHQLDLDPTDVTLIFDKGNISQEAFSGIDSSGLQFICTIRPSSHKDLHDLTADDFKMVRLPNGKEIGFKEYTRKLHSQDRRLIVCYDGNRKQWYEKNKLAKIQKKIQAIHTWFETRLNTHKWRSKDNVEEKIEKMMGKRFLSYVDYRVKETKDGELSYDLSMDNDYFDSEVAKLGKSYLMTSHGTDWTAGQIIWLYRQQYTVEKLFSYLKDHPQAVTVRPIYHHKDESVRGHIFVCLLGVLLLLLLKRKVNTFYPEMELDEICRGLEDIKIADIAFSESDIRYKIIKNSTLATQLLKKLDLNKYLIETP